MTNNPLVQEILDFWFGASDSAELGSRRTIWFESTPQFDQEIRTRFSRVHEQAASGALDSWAGDVLGSLALIIILDQFSRNLYRGKAEAFACDAKARSIAKQALMQNFDKGLLTVQRLFFYLPFEHSEDLSIQEKSVELFVQLGDATSLKHALCHRDQIVRFGRFPDRNKALGRTSTLAEQRFLAHPFC